MSSILKTPVVKNSTGSESGQSVFDCLASELTHAKNGKLTKKQKETKAFLEKIQADHIRELEKIEELKALEKFNTQKADQKKEHKAGLEFWRSPQGQAQKELIAIIQREVNEWIEPEGLWQLLTPLDKKTKYAQVEKIILNTSRKYQHEPDTKKIVIRKVSQVQPVEQMPIFQGMEQRERIEELLKIIRS